MNENLKKLMEEMSKNPDLAKIITKAGNDEILAIANELNITLTEEDLKVSEHKELSEGELEAVTGGGGCGCAVGGIGEYDGLQCGCVVLGTGSVDQRTSYCTGAGEGVCVCPAAGAGATDGRECYGQWTGCFMLGDK